MSYARGLIVLALLAGAATPAAAQNGLVCSDAADAIATGMTAGHTVAGAPLTVAVEPKDGRTAPVTDLTVSLDSDGVVVPMQPPAPGTVSQATLPLPGVAGRVVLTFTWNQGPEPGIAEACSGRDAYVLKVGPSASQLRAYLGRVAVAQVVWNQRRKTYLRVIERFEAGLDAVPHDDASVFAYVRTAARQALAGFVPARRLSAQYRRKVLAARPPTGFGLVNRDLARSPAPYDLVVRRGFEALSRARNLADLERANAIVKDSGATPRRLRRPWSTAIAAAAKEAGITPPPWALEVGK